MRHTLLSLSLLVLWAPAVPAQVTVVDEGSFTITRAGTRVGREDFSIRHVPTTPGAYETLTRGVVVAGARRTTVDLNADSLGRPVRFQSSFTDDGRAGESYRAEITGRRYSARARRQVGESARELMLPPDALIVDDGVLHPLQFVVARGPGRVMAVVPSRGLVVGLTVEDLGEDRVSIALVAIEARRYAVREDASGTERQVWVDREGRVLKVAMVSDALVAVRDEAPRTVAR
ncbi:MAG: hypothetical protein FJ363_01705 [Gemmatimonadetes bacterium]|nr:hypothetical protein [Gemmatimonadota bacterium]